MTAISSTSSMVSINPAPAVYVEATGQDGNFETRLNSMEIAIFKLGTNLEKFILISNPFGKSRGENDIGYLTDFSVNASPSEIDQFSDDESNCGPALQKKLSKNSVNIDSKDELRPAILNQLAEVAMKYWSKE